MAFNLIGSWYEVPDEEGGEPVTDPDRLHHAVDNRLFAADVFGHGVGGVVAATHLFVSERGAGANMSVDVAAGGCIIPSTRSVHQGSYPGYNSAVINVPISAADPTNARIDRVLARAKDPAQDAAFEGDEGIDIFVEQGTPAAVPTSPAVTVEDWIELARVTVPASASSITDAEITDFRQINGLAPSTGFTALSVDLSGGPTSGTTELLLAGSLTIPAQNNVDRLVVPSMHLFVSATTATTTRVTGRIRETGLAGAVRCQTLRVWSGSGITDTVAGRGRPFLLPAGASVTLVGTLQQSNGAGDFSIGGAQNLNGIAVETYPGFS